MDLGTNNHSVFLLNYYLVLIVRYRKEVIDDNISNRLSIDIVRKYIENQGMN